MGVRAVSRVLSLLAVARGIQKAPCPHTVLHWVTRLAIVRMQPVSMRKGSGLSQAPFSNGLSWMIAVSIALGAGKIVAVLALDAQHPLDAVALSLTEGQRVVLTVVRAGVERTLSVVVGGG